MAEFTLSQQIVPYAQDDGRRAQDDNGRNVVGLFWDLYQQSQISRQGERSANMEARMDNLERNVDRLATLLRDVIGRLEENVGTDLDKDGKVGR